MAVYTDIAEEELRNFLANYDIGDLMSYHGIAEGVENSNFLLHTTKASFILTLYEQRVDANDLPFFINLMEHLSGSQVVAPHPVRTRAGDALGYLAGRPAAIVTFLEGVWPRKPKPKHCFDVGRVMAKLHIATADFKLERPNTLSVNAWRPLFDGAKDRADSVTPGLRDELARELDKFEANWPKNLPRGTIHGDLFPDNVFFLSNELSGLIDFYFACTDFLAYDLAICLNAWCFEQDNAFNITKGKAIIDGYQSVRKLTQEEVENLPLLTQGAAIRFLLTRLLDWLNVPPGALVVPKNPMEYVAKLRFHRSVSHASAYGFGLDNS